MDKNVIDAEFTVVSEPIPPPLKWWQGWRIEFNPWPGIIVGATVLPALVMRLLNQQ